MTRKHFIALSQALKDSKANYSTCSAVAVTCRQFNPHFDYDKFMEACGH